MTCPKREGEISIQVFTNHPKMRTFAEFLRAGTMSVAMSSRGRMEAMAAHASTASNRTESWSGQIAM